MPHSQGLSNNPYPELQLPNSLYNKRKTRKGKMIKNILKRRELYFYSWWKPQGWLKAPIPSSFIELFLPQWCLQVGVILFPSFQHFFTIITKITNRFVNKSCSTKYSIATKYCYIWDSSYISMLLLKEQT